MPPKIELKKGQTNLFSFFKKPAPSVVQTESDTIPTIAPADIVSTAVTESNINAKVTYAITEVVIDIVPNVNFIDGKHVTSKSDTLCL